MSDNINFEISPRSFTRVLVAVDEDDSHSSIRAFNYAVTTAKRLNAPLGIVSILEVEDFNIFDTLSPEVMKQRRSQVTDDLARYVNKARSFGVKEIQAFTGEGKPADIIINDILPEFNPDLLVCGSKTKPVNERKKIFIGSQASAMAQNAPCSVIVVR
ncbi:universal stress protein [Ligilactobacillus sp. WILCCON 0076]|uniref:Universal stress protein n=1 Tax=Ligilactobacillus ubinensis TaxID=2876789 RepID=A0A9X2JMI0_9LACO|nr:universal stress protein [Ligilactobacillus ubinensis]MCP0887700.1 universal stress protein [Ligilactobacillus ubinensis]